MSFAVKEQSRSIRRRGYPAAIAMFAEELACVSGYWIGLLVLFGAWRLRHLPVRPVDRFTHLFFLLFSLAVIRFAAVEGYLSARHLLALLVAGIGCGGYGGLQLGHWLARCRPFGRGSTVLDPEKNSDRAGVAGLRRAAGLADPKGADSCFSWPAWAVVWLLIVAGVVRLFEPLHANHAEYRTAGGWLASQADVPGTVLDSRGWTGLYSGRPTYHYEAARTAFCDPQLAYVVLERRELEYPGGRSRTLRYLLRLAAEPARAFASRPNRPEVVVYRWHPERLSRLSATRPGEFETEDLRHGRAH
jgi:hypothetical protein